MPKVINYPIRMEPQVYEMLHSLISCGTVTLDGKAIDFTPVQQIAISNGVMTFTPPARITADVGPISLRTTISSLTVRAGGIKIEVDNSPIDLELRPK